MIISVNDHSYSHRFFSSMAINILSVVTMVITPSWDIADKTATEYIYII